MRWQVFAEAFGLAMFALAFIAAGQLTANHGERYSECRAPWAMPLLMASLPLAVFCVVIARSS